jgi:hypothetical protein
MGGRALIFLSDDDTSSSNAIASEFGLSYLSNSVLKPNGTDASSSLSSFSLTNVDINSKLSLNSETNIVTDQLVESISIESQALDISDVNNKSLTPYLFSQEYFVYDLFNLPNDLAYDKDNSGLINGNETMEDTSLGVAIDLLKGGRISIIPSTAMISDNYLTEEDNIPFLLRLLPWNSRITNTIKIHSVSTDVQGVTRDDKITVRVNLTDGLGTSLVNSEDLDLLLEISIGGNIIDELHLSGTGPVYTGEITVSYSGWLNMDTTAFLEGFGFAEGETIALFSQNTIEPYNDLSDIAPIMLAVFVISIMIVGVVWLRTRE